MLLAHPSQTIPPLENGDRLTRAEFERRYTAMPHVKNAELIEGVVYMSSPVRLTQHGEPHARIMAWLGVYWAATSGVQVGDNVTVRLDLDNEPQPDAVLRYEEGQSTVSPEGYIEGAPELVVEIAASSVAIDLYEKLTVYRRNQVREYVVWRVEEQALDWFCWHNGEYVQLAANEAGVLCSQVFPGLWLATDALLAGDLGTVLAALQAGLAQVSSGSEASE